MCNALLLGSGPLHLSFPAQTQPPLFGSPPDHSISVILRVTLRLYADSITASGVAPIATSTEVGKKPLTPCGNSLINITNSTHSSGEQPVTAIIPPTSSQRASNIPLRSLQSDLQSTRFQQSASEKGSRRSSHSSARSAESDFSIWSDTGDLAEQFTEVEDPLQTHLRNSVDRELLGRRGRRKPKHVHYSSGLSDEPSGIDIEKIRIPNPPPRSISRAERVLAAIMTPRSASNAQMHGLVGKPLL